MSQENVELLRAVYEQYGRGNFRAGLDLFDPHVVLVARSDLPDADRRIGVDSISAYMREYLDPLTDVTWTAEEFIEADGSVVVAARQRGMGKGSKLSVDACVFTVWTFRGRMVIRIEFFADRAEALEAVGLRE